MPTFKYVAGETPPCVTNNDPDMASIAPAKNSMNPKVAKVSFTFREPADANTQSDCIKELLASMPAAG